MAPMLLFAWGDNACGQCGAVEDAPARHRHVLNKPHCMNSSLVRELSPLTPVVSVAAGAGHTLILTAFGEVFGCGRAREGQLGAEADVWRSSRLVRVTALNSWHIVQIACGSNHSMAVEKQGRAFEWGLLLPNQALRAKREKSSWAARRSGLGKDLEEDLNAMQRRVVAASWNRFLNNVEDNVEEEGISQQDLDDDCSIKVLRTDVGRVATRRPRRCIGLDGRRVRYAACGYAHSLVLLEEGDLFAAGYGEKGQLGSVGRLPRERFERVRLPEAIAVPARAGLQNALVACGLNHSAAVVASSQQVYTWGLGVFGQLGLGANTKECFLPRAVELPGAVVQLACGDNHTVAITCDGSLYSFGHRDAVGGTSHQQRLPVKMESAPAKVESLHAGGTGTFAVLPERGCNRQPLLSAWGYNQRYLLGRYTAELQMLHPGPVALPPLAEARVQSLGAGAGHCVAALEPLGSCVLPFEDAEAFVGSPALLAALRGKAPFDVRVLAADGSGGEALGAHRCVLRARCPQLADELQVSAADEERPWTLPLPQHGCRCVGALLEYLYTDFCRAGAKVSSELRPLAQRLQLQRLSASIGAATETDSVSEGLRWLRSSEGKWIQVEEQAASPGDSGAQASTYVRDLEALVVQAAVAEVDAVDFVALSIRRRDGPGRGEADAYQPSDEDSQTVSVALPVLQAIDYFSAFLDGDFLETASCGSRLVGAAVNAPPGAGPRKAARRAEVVADDVGAMVLCLRMLATGNLELMPRDPVEALTVLVEAHRLDLPEVVRAAAHALGEGAARGDIGRELMREVVRLGSLFDLPCLCRIWDTGAGLGQGKGPADKDATEDRSEKDHAADGAQSC